MSEPEIERLATRVQRLEALVSQLDGRLDVLEARGGPSLAGAPERAPAAALQGPEITINEADVAGTLSLVGRTFIVCAGAYLLRALTDMGAIAAGVGAVAGLAYAALWGLAADRAAAAGRRTSGYLHGTAAVLVAYPLLWEAPLRFGLVAPGTAAAALALVTAGLLVLAWRRELHAFAWMVTAAGLVTGLALGIQTQDLAPFAAYLNALGIATLWLGYDKGWTALRWPAALVANVAVLAVTSRAMRPIPLEPVPAALLLQVLLVTAYLSSIATRTLWLGRNVIPFELVQATAGLIVGLGGAIALTRATGYGGLTVGLSALVIGAASYAVAFAFVDRRQGRGVNFYFYSSLGLVFTLTGTSVLLQPRTRALTWAGLALCAAWASSRFSRAALSAHAAVCVAGAAVVGNVFGAAWTGLLGTAGTAVAGAAAVAWGVAAAGAGSFWLAYRPAPDSWWHPARVPRAIMALLFLGTFAGLVSRVVSELTRTAFAPDFAEGLAVALRTGVLAASALLLSALGRRPANLELRWLVYPVLIVGGLKILLDDFLHCPPSTLVLALSFYGLALIVAPRLARPPTGVGQPSSHAHA